MVSNGSKSVFRSTLSNPNYAKFLSGQVIAAFGDRINQTALLGIIVYETGNTSKFSADIMFWQVLPAVVLGLFAVALIDRWNRKTTMIVSDLARAVLACCLPVLWMVFHHHYAIYSVVFLMGAFGALFVPCRLAIMPNLVPSNLLMSANAISSQAGTIATLIGAPIGAWLVENFGRKWSFVINGATYVISAIFIWSLKPSKGDPAEIPLERPHPLDDFRTGLGYIWKAKPVLFYVLFTGITQCIVAVFFVCFLSYSVDVLGLTVNGTTRLFLALGVGMGVGAIWCIKNASISSSLSWPMWMMATTGSGMLLLGWTYNAVAAAAVLFLMGFCAVMVLVPVDTFLQKYVPDSLRGRVFAARGVLVGGGFLLSLQFSKALIYHMGALDVLKLLGSASILIALVTGCLASRSVKEA